ncbi:drug resistance transporter, EmrB/QacA subfamily [Streptoalloteichus tenebrarius]|uniref:Drug resistance transporter, EmrB/QacA subfamily n=1 Tax=Streptoalloteichus tenebrarius (strain ATCC 17920 / DSM 40477 / JCM 4838 / CBS 697.72 / NBRC 16177 / NCIMB 11028 / NRRL B-12390 / A12253. 1 / ISP 5477) TaxID=1933 RepID=A0ABT1I0N8_STRSD|nr:drug resistance transporter, EmrB/QacA subfamily [Streptoalloteichus tenebrarius]
MTARPDATPPGAGTRRVVTVAVCLCVALVFGLGAAVNLAVGRLSTSAPYPSPTEVLWIIDSYLVAFGCLLVPAGALGDRVGRKGAMLTGLAVLAVGSVGSALAPTVPTLLVARAVAGAGAALVLPSSLPLLTRVFPADQRGRAVATWTAMSGIGGVAGNVLGGVVLQYADWRVLFAVAAPLALVGMALVAVTAPRVPRHEQPLDPVGVVLLVAAVLALLTGIIEGQRAGWLSGFVLLAFGAAAALLVVFVLVELRLAHPLVDPRVFLGSGARTGTIGIIVSFVAMYSVFALNGQYLMSVKGYPAVLAGLGTLPMAVMLFVASPRAGRLAERFGTRAVVVSGLLGVAVGLLLYSLCGPDTPYPLYAVCMVLVGTGSGLSNPLLSMAILTSLPASKAGLGSGINSFSREIGGAVGFALFGTLLNGAFGPSLPAPVRDLAGAAGEEVRGSVASALAFVHERGGPETAVLDHAVRVAFSDAAGFALRVVAVLVAVAAVLVASWLPRRGAPDGD